MESFIIVGITLFSVYILDRWDNRLLQKLFEWVPAILLAYLIPAGISLLFGKDYSAGYIHTFNKEYLILLAVLASMSSLSLVQLKAIGWKPLAVFLAGSLWIAVFPILLIVIWLNQDFVAEVLKDLEYWKGLPPIVGSWIGGSTSQLVLKEIVNCPEHIFLTILVMDNVLVNVWTILMFQGIKESNFLNQKLGITDSKMPVSLEESSDGEFSLLLIAVVLIASVFLVNVVTENYIAKILLLSGLGLVLGNYVKGWNVKIALKMGSLLILIVMAVLGLKLRFSAFELNLELLFFLVIWLISHLFVMLGLAKILNVNVAWVPIASMANVGGIATAPAVTAAYEKKWMPHAIVLAILSMATGTFWGMLTIFLLKMIFDL
ncbi:DUF819 family protein [Portibacter marinus]|uniref:DUF819 family protein n=1 Tax=Portibacter marinus TaxID=2898660 RepID=UPI001F330B57|nr:DUF819 family protein [Portibacter marinus]